MVDGGLRMFGSVIDGGEVTRALSVVAADGAANGGASGGGGTRYVIVGAGPAGVSAAETLGAAAPADAKTLFDALEAELYGPPATVGSVPISAWSLVMAVRQAGKQPATVTALPKLYQER